MKTTPKKSLLSLALLMATWGNLPTWAADRAVFKDVSAQHHFALVGKALVGMKIVQGYPDGRFRGERVISRYESAQILANLVTYLEIVYQKRISSRPLALQPVSDIPDNHWARAAVQMMMERGFLEPFPDQTFRGDEKMTLLAFKQMIFEVIRATPAKLNETNPIEPEMTRYQVAAYILRLFQIDPVFQAKTVQQFPKEAHLLQAVSYQQNQEYDKAVKEVDWLLQQDPNDKDAYPLRGTLHLQQNQPEKALADFQQGLKLDPDNPRVHQGLGNTYALQGQAEKALPHYSKSVELDPQQPDVYRQRAAAYWDNGQKEQALNDYNKAVELAPHQPENYRQRATVFRDSGAYEKSLADYNKALQLDPQSYSTYRSRGTTYAFMQQFEPAHADLDYALQFSPQDPITLELKAWVYYIQGKPEQARQYFEKMWPQIQPQEASDWAGWIADNLPHLLKNVNPSPDQGPLKTWLAQARQNDKQALLAVYQEMLRFQGVRVTIATAMQSHSSTVQIVEATGEASGGSQQTWDQVKQAALADAKRMALEQAGVRVSTQTTVDNFQLTEDQIKTYADGYIKVLKVLREEPHSDPVMKTLHMKVTIQAEVQVAEAQNMLNAFKQSHQTEKTYLNQGNLSFDFNILAFTPPAYQHVGLKEGDALPSGSRLQIHFTPHQPCYVYILSVDGQGKLDTLLPAADGIKDNYLTAQQSYILPRSGKFYELFYEPKDHGGEETIYFIASYSKMEDMVALLNQKGDQEVVKKINTAIRMRSISRVVEGPTETYAVDPNTRITTSRERIEGQGHVMRVFKFKHL